MGVEDGIEAPPPLRGPDREVLRAAVDELAPHLPAFCAEITRRVMAGQPALVAAVDHEVALLEAATAANVGTILSTLAHGVTPAGLDVPRAVDALLDELASDETGLLTLLRAYRLAEADLNRLWTARLARHAADADQLARLVAHSVGHVSAYIDRGSEVIVARWSAIVDAAQRTGRRRDAAMRAMLRGEAVDPASLEHPVELPQVVLAVQAGTPAATRAALRDVSAALGHPPRLGLELPDGSALAWFGVDRAPERVPAVLAAAGDGAWLVVAATAGGVERMGRAASEVREGLDALRRTRPAGAAVPYAEVALLSTLLADEPRARRLMHAVLGPLAEATPRHATLRDTLRAYFETGERKRGAGARLGVHEKTVAHRLARIEELLGTRVGDRRVDLETALLVERATAG